MSSILTNTSAMVALQTLKSVNANLQETQSQISTGKSVASAKDNSAVWAISKSMDSDVKGFMAISESLALGESTVAVARNASETVTDLLTEIKGRIVAAQESNVDRSKIQTDIDELTDQIRTVVDAAQFNGLNLVKGTRIRRYPVVARPKQAPASSAPRTSVSTART
jgi:flagellin